MADGQAIAQALRSLFITAWDALSNGFPSATHLCPDNNPDWSEPKDSNGRPETWLRLTVEPATNDQVTFGVPTGGRYDRMGSFIVEILAPVNTGTSEIEGLIDSATVILRGQETSGIRIFNPRPVRVGIVEDVYYKMNVEATWQHFETA
jgi:hypothetical protein